MVVLYDASKGMLRTAMTRAGTVLPHVLGHFEFWCFLAIHLFIKGVFMLGLLVDAEVEGTFWHMSWKNVQVITAITTFFAVFYSNQSYSRYLHLYLATRKSLGFVYSFAFLSKLTFQHCNPQHMRLAFRFVASSTYFALQCAKYNKDMPEEVAHLLLRNRFLTTVEVRHLNEIKPEERSLRLQQWATEVISLAVEEHLAHPKPKDKPDFRTVPQARPLPTGNATLYFKMMVEMRENNDNIQDTLNMPVPFQYFHILNLMVIVNISLWSYRMALNDSLFTICVFTLAMVIFMGMLELANQLSCPYGQDEVDFPLDDWITECFRRAADYMENRSPGAVDGWSLALQVQGPLCFMPSEGTGSASVSPHIQDPLLGGGNSGPLSDAALAAATEGTGSSSAVNQNGSAFSSFFGYMPLTVKDQLDQDEHNSPRPDQSSKNLRLEERREWRQHHTTVAAQMSPQSPSMSP